MTRIVQARWIDSTSLVLALGLEEVAPARPHLEFSSLALGSGSRSCRGYPNQPSLYSSSLAPGRQWFKSCTACLPNWSYLDSSSSAQAVVLLEVAQARRPRLDSTSSASGRHDKLASSMPKIDAMKNSIDKIKIAAIAKTSLPRSPAA